MRKLQPTKSSSILNRTTPVPHWILDEAMPLLTDTELRVLLVVTRSTLGWREGEGRKESDWLSHRQLQARTGRSSAVVSRAIDGLVKQEMLVVSNANGEALSSAKARSRARGQLFFRVTPPHELKGSRLEESANNATGGTYKFVSLGRDYQVTTTSNSEALYGAECSLATGITSESKAPKPGVASEMVPRKLRTTKETGTKEIKNTGSRVITLKVPTLENEVSAVALGDLYVLASPDEQNPHRIIDLGATEGGKGEPTNGQPQKSNIYEEDDVELSINARRFVASFHRAHGIARRGENPAPIGRSGAELLEARLENHSVEELEFGLPQFFSCTFGYVCRRNWSLECYLDSFAILRFAFSSKHEAKLSARPDASEPS